MFKAIDVEPIGPVRLCSEAVQVWSLVSLSLIGSWASRYRHFTEKYPCSMANGKENDSYWHQSFFICRSSGVDSSSDRLYFAFVLNVDSAAK